jgi:hypothetical protein
MATDGELDDEVSRALESARREIDTRREMKSKQVKKTPYGEIRFYFAVDLPADMPEDVFKKAIAEYGLILNSAFKE